MPSDYERLSSGSGFVALPARTVIEVSGEDRARLLQNLCTADVGALHVGHGTEAFFTDVKGRVLAHVFVLRGAESIALDTVGDQAQVLMSHLDRYIIREDVQLHDRSSEMAHIIVSGKHSAASVSQVFGVSPDQMLTHGGGRELVIRSPMVVPPNFLVRVPVETRADAESRLKVAGSSPCGLDALEALRIEACFPYYGTDITERNLPQEVGRNDQAISFTKGCYLGQETVARLDALGHVNWELSVLRTEHSDAIAPGTELNCDGHVVARACSSMEVPHIGGLVLMAYVRTANAKTGAVMETDRGNFMIQRVGGGLP